MHFLIWIVGNARVSGIAQIYSRRHLIFFIYNTFIVKILREKGVSREEVKSNINSFNQAQLLTICNYDR